MKRHSLSFVVLLSSLVILLLSLISPHIVWADEQKHLKNPVWVMVFWLHPLDYGNTVDIDSIELGGESVSPENCAALPMREVLKPIDDAAKKIEAGLTPVVVCGIAAPTHESKDKPPVRSEPGHPDQPQGPSGPIVYLPHRPLHEIDIQGHQIPISLANPCGQQQSLYVADDDGNWHFVECYAATG